MKGISCNSNLLSDLPVEQAMDVLGEHGYAAIDICLEIAPPFVPVPTPHLSPEDGAAKRDRVRKRAEEAGIAIAALNAHTNLCARDPAERAANARFLEGSVQMAADLGAPIVVTAGGGKNAYGYEQWFFDWTVEVLRQVLPTAERLGIALAIEAGSPAGSLIYNLKTMQKLLDTAGLEGLRALFDCAHYHMRGDSPVTAFNTLKDRIVHMHAKDAAGDPENIVFPPPRPGGSGLRRLAGRHGPGRIRRLHRHGVRGLCLGLSQGLPEGPGRKQGLPGRSGRQALGGEPERPQALFPFPFPFEEKLYTSRCLGSAGARP